MSDFLPQNKNLGWTVWPLTSIFGIGVDLDLGRVATSKRDMNSLPSPGLFGTLFPDFPWPHDTDGYHVKSQAKQEKILHLQPLGLYKNMPKNQGQTLGPLSQIIFPDFPWLLTKNIEIPWLSRRSKFSLIFPDDGNPA